MARSLTNTVEVDLGSIAHNIRYLKTRCKGGLWVVLKSDAYGHGLIEVGKWVDKQGVGGLATQQPHSWTH